MQNKNILLTAGFIGSNFVPYFLEKPRPFNIRRKLRYKFIKGDRELVEFIFSEYDINGVIHFAAESHVDNSIKNPGVFVQTNGTFTLIDVAFEYKNCRFQLMKLLMHQILHIQHQKHLVI